MNTIEIPFIIILKKQMHGKVSDKKLWKDRAVPPCGSLSSGNRCTEYLNKKLNFMSAAARTTDTMRKPYWVSDMCRIKDKWSW